MIDPAAPSTEQTTVKTGHGMINWLQLLRLVGYWAMVPVGILAGSLLSFEYAGLAFGSLLAAYLVASVGKTQRVLRSFMAVALLNLSLIQSILIFLVIKGSSVELWMTVASLILSPLMGWVGFRLALLQDEWNLTVRKPPRKHDYLGLFLGVFVGLVIMGAVAAKVLLYPDPLVDMRLPLPALIVAAFASALVARGSGKRLAAVVVGLLSGTGVAFYLVREQLHSPPSDFAGILFVFAAYALLICVPLAQLGFLLQLLIFRRQRQRLFAAWDEAEADAP